MRTDGKAVRLVAQSLQVKQYRRVGREGQFAALRQMEYLPPLAAVVRKATAPDAAGRYQTVREMAADLARFRDGRPVSAYREPLPERLLRVYRRYELPILLVLAYVLMRAALLVWKGF